MAMTGFRTYREKVSAEIQAQPLEATVTLPDENGDVGTFVAGDYMVLKGGVLTGEKRETFEASYEIVRKALKPLSDEERAAKSAKAKATREANVAKKLAEAAGVGKA